MIIVAGGSGLLGRQIVGDLLARGQSVRALARDADRARTVLGDRVDIVAADIRNPAGLDAAVAGASMIISAVHGFLGGRGAGPVEVDERGTANLVQAAAATGAGLTLVSVIGAAADSSLELFRAKHAAEMHLRTSGVPWTIVRAGPYLETWLTILAETAGKSGRPMIFGRGRQPLDFVAVADVATVVTRACLDPALRGQVLEVAGPPVTMTELAHALQEARGWHGNLRHVPRPILRAAAILAGPVNPAFARKNRTALVMDTTTTKTRTVATDLLGRAPRNVAEVLSRPLPV